MLTLDRCRMEFGFPCLVSSEVSVAVSMSEFLCERSLRTEPACK